MVDYSRQLGMSMEKEKDIEARDLLKWDYRSDRIDL